MIKEVEGNLLTYPGIQVVGHQTNCLGVMGAGIAKQIKNKYPKVYETYHNYCVSQPDPHNLVGTVQFVLSDDNKQVFANIFGQYSFSERRAPFDDNGKPRHTNYTALKEAFRRLHVWLVLNDKTTCGIPYKIGCGLAGGDWDVVYPIIKEEFEDEDDITLYIVKYDK